MLRKLFYPHSLIVTCLMFLLIWALDIIRINLHFLNPFNETIRDYEITDIVYSRLRGNEIKLDNRIVLVNSGHPNRDTLRMMVDRIREAGAKVVAVDMYFSEHTNSRRDSLLRLSFHRMPNVVLGARLDSLVKGTEIFKAPVDCDPFFYDSVYSGFINFVSHDTSTIRLFSAREETTEGNYLSFAAQTAKLYNPQAVERLFRRNKEVEEIYFSGNADQFVQFESTDILDSTKDLRARLRDKIVLIGFLGTYAWDNPMLDRHYTPLNPRYTGRNAPDMYGVVIHANIIRMILDNTYVRKPSFWVNLLLTVLFFYFNIHLYYQIFRRVSVPYQFITRFLQLGEIIILFFIVALLFHFYRIKMDVAYWITALLLTFDVVKFYDNVLRKRVPFISRIPDEFPKIKRAPKRAQKAIEKPKEEQPIVAPNPPKSTSEKQ